MGLSKEVNKDNSTSMKQLKMKVKTRFTTLRQQAKCDEGNRKQSLFLACDCP